MDLGERVAIEHAAESPRPIMERLGGMLDDRLLTRGFDAINSEDATEWMRRHGAPSFVVKSPFVELGYHYAFSYIDGDKDQPSMAAGAALRGYMRMFFGQVGSFFYHFNGGMGDGTSQQLHRRV